MANPTQNGVLKRDDNDVPVMGGTSSVDNTTIINSAFDPVTRRLLTDSSSGSGTVTEVDTGVGLTGGPITTTGTISLDSKLAPLDTLGTAGQLIRVNAGATALEYFTAASGGVASVVGTANRITVNSTDPANPIVDIAATYVGQTSITTLGTITTGTWSATTIALNKGGTGQTTKTAAFDALQPMTTGGDIIYGGASGTGTRLANGSAGQVLTSGGTTVAPTWSTITTAGLTVGTSTITSGTNTRILYDNSGVLGEYTITGTGTVVAMQTNPTLSGITMTDATNIILNATTGTKIGTATTQKLGFYNATPIVQPTGDVITALQNLGLGASLTVAATTITSRTLWGQTYDGSGNVSGSLTAVGNITGGASSMTITAGTGNSRTLALQSTTSGGTATTFLTGNADQTVTFASGFTAAGASSIGTGNAFTTGTIELGAASDTTLARSGAGQVSIEGVQIDTISNSVTLTNKTLTAPIMTTVAETGIGTADLLAPNNHTITVSSNAGSASQSFLVNTFTNSSAATMAITIPVATPTPKDGQFMVVRIYDFSGVAQTIGWTNTENSTVSVPTTSNGSTTLPLSVCFEYNGATSKWRCLASS